MSDREFDIPERLITLQREEELPHWAQLLGCSEDDLRATVQAVDEVERELQEYHAA